MASSGIQPRLKGMVKTGAERRGTPVLVLVVATGLAVAGSLAAVFLGGKEARVVPGVPPPALSAEATGGPRSELVGAAHGAEEEASTAEAIHLGGERTSPAAAERMPVAIGLHGRVIEAESGAPLPGVALERSFAGAVVDRARSNADGAYAFAPDVAMLGTLRAVKEGWRFKPSRRALRDRDPALELVYEGTAIVAAPVRGLLLDERTREPVGRYRLTLQGSRNEQEEVFTAADGSFLTSRPFEAGEVTLWLSELGETQTLDHQGQGEAHELLIPVGPLLLFDLEGPADMAVEDLAVSLVDAAEPVLRWHARAVEQGWTDLLEDAPSKASAFGFPLGGEAFVRTDGDPAWVRLPPLDPHELPAQGPGGYAVLIADDGRHLAGVGHTPALGSTPGSRIRVSLQPFCDLAGTVATHDGAPLRGALVSLRGPGLGSGLACVTERNGDFHCEAPLGTYELGVESLHGSLRRSVTLEDKEASVSLLLDAVEGMQVAGTISSRSGTWSETPVLELRSTVDPRLRYRATVGFPKTRSFFGLVVDPSQAPPVATFEFASVPAGSYELLAHSCAGYTWEPERTFVDRSATNLELVLADDAQKTALSFDVRAADGRPLPDPGVCLWIEGEMHRLGFSGPENLEVATGSSMGWLVVAEGCVPAAGTCRAELPQQTVEVVLQRGAGLVVLALSPCGEGVEAEVLLDGRSAGSTDAFGMAALALRGDVRSVHLRCAGWETASAEVDLEEGFAIFQLVPAD